MECIRCKQVQPESKFRLYKNGSYRKQCKKCDNEYDKQRKQKAREQRLETTLANCKLCKESKPLKDFAKLKKYDGKICLACYPDHVRKCKTKWCAKERIANPSYRIKKSLAARLRTVLRKNDTTMNYIGCTIQFLREWLEYNFTKDMSWDNYGDYWSIDHVVPVSTFDLTNEEQKYQCWNWTNLYPVKISYNCSKKNKICNVQIQKVKERILKFQEEGSTTKWFSEDLCILLRYSLILTER